MAEHLLDRPQVGAAVEEMGGGGVPERVRPARGGVTEGFEAGVDVIKVGYTGDFASFRDTVASCPIPVVIAGGPKTTATASGA